MWIHVRVLLVQPLHWAGVMRKIVGMTVVLALGAGGCIGGDAGDVEDGLDDSFGAEGGKDDSPSSCRVRKLANLASQDELDYDVGLSKRAAKNIFELRAGDDGAIDTQDDGWYATLHDLDVVKYVGPATLKRMREYAADHAEYQCGSIDVQLLAFNDFHGNMEPPSGSSGRIPTGPNPDVDRVDAGGVEFMATHMARLAADNPNTTIVAAGDIIGATPLLSAAFHDEPSIESMNLLGLSVSSVGNHEFDKGAAELLRMQGGGCHPSDGCQDGDGFEGARFAYLGANVIDDATGDTLLPSYSIRRYGGTRIGFIGLTLEGTPLVTSASGVEGLTFLDEAETINALVPELRDQGVNTIVVLIHEGGAQTGLYDQCAAASGPIMAIVDQLDPAIELVITGHTHNSYICVVGNRLVTSAAHAGRLITDIDLTVDERSGAITAKAARNVIVTRDVEKNPAQTALIAHYKPLIAPIANRVVGSATADLTRVADADGETTMGEVIADAQRASTQGAGAVIAAMNPGGVRADLLMSQISGGEAVGQITYGEAFSVQPFSNNLVTLTITGAQLDTLLEQQWSMVGTTIKVNMLAVSGLTYAWSASAPIGSRVDAASILVGGSPVVATASYRVTVNSFLATGGDGFAVLKDGTERTGGGDDLAALDAYLTAHPGLAAPARDRVTMIP
jgi:5'-nucleotidase